MRVGPHRRIHECMLRDVQEYVDIALAWARQPGCHIPLIAGLGDEQIADRPGALEDPLLSDVEILAAGIGPTLEQRLEAGARELGSVVSEYLVEPSVSLVSTPRLIVPASLRVELLQVPHDGPDFSLREPDLAHLLDPRERRPDPGHVGRSDVGRVELCAASRVHPMTRCASHIASRRLEDPLAAAGCRHGSNRRRRRAGCGGCHLTHHRLHRSLRPALVHESCGREGQRPAIRSICSGNQSRTRLEG